MNESNSEGYAAHPYWGGIKYGDACSEDGQLKAYRDAQFSKGEAKLQNGLTLMWNLVALGALAHRLFAPSSNLRWRGTGHALRHGLGSALLGYMGGLMVLTHTHFEGDVSYMTGERHGYRGRARGRGGGGGGGCSGGSRPLTPPRPLTSTPGAVIHHAEEASPGMNLKMATLAQGYLLCGAAALLRGARRCEAEGGAAAGRHRRRREAPTEEPAPRSAPSRPFPSSRRFQARATPKLTPLTASRPSRRRWRQG